VQIIFLPVGGIFANKPSLTPEERKKVRIKPVVINLTAEQTLRLTRILVDKDQEEALAFLMECLKPRLDQSTRDH